MAHLVELAVEFASRHLKPEGALVAKVFHGSGYSQLVELFKQTFRVVKPIKPKASRDKSAETFLVGIGLKTRRDASTASRQARECADPLPHGGMRRRPRALTGLESTSDAVDAVGPACAARRSCHVKRSRGEQSMVLEGRGLAGDRAGAVHRLQAVRPRRDAGRRRSATPSSWKRCAPSASRRVDAAGRPAAAPRSAPSPTTTSALRTTATYLDRGLVGDLIKTASSSTSSRAKSRRS